MISFPYFLFVSWDIEQICSVFTDGFPFHEYRVDDLILEAIEKLKEPRGSSRHSIAEYILVLFANHYKCLSYI